MRRFFLCFALGCMCLLKLLGGVFQVCCQGIRVVVSRMLGAWRVRYECGGAAVFLPLPFGERVGVRRGCSLHGFIFSRHPGGGRDPVAVSVVIASSVIATWPLTQRAFRPPAGGRVTFLLLAQKIPRGLASRRK